LDLPESIAGIEVEAYKPRHMILVDLAGSPYILGEKAPIEMVRPEHIAQFLWIVSPNYSASDRKARDKFTKSIRRRNFATMHEAICAYLGDAFQDSPPQSEKPKKPFTSWCSILVDLFACQYGWTDEYTLSIPFKRLWQYHRAIASRLDPKATHINRSDKVRVDYAAELNRKRKEEAK
jgi:hypothetical protein